MLKVVLSRLTILWSTISLLVSWIVAIWHHIINFGIVWTFFTSLGKMFSAEVVMHVMLGHALYSMRYFYCDFFVLG